MTRAELVEKMAQAAEPELWAWWDKLTDGPCPPHVAIEIMEQEIAKFTAALTAIEAAGIPVGAILSGECVVIGKEPLMIATRDGLISAEIVAKK